MKIFKKIIFLSFLTFSFYSCEPEEISETTNDIISETEDAKNVESRPDGDD